jgi:catechol 2,3-dioxygenase-like lactoylglutathione lyase family enzyme
MSTTTTTSSAPITTQIFRTAFTVSDIDRSLRFYRDGLGLRVVRDKLRDGESYDSLLGLPGVRLRVVLLEGVTNGGLLELAQYFAPVRPTGKTPHHADVGSANVCFLVEDLDATLSRLAGNGFVAGKTPSDFVQEGRVVGRVVMIFDPDGIPLVLMQRKDG